MWQRNVASHPLLASITWPPEEVAGDSGQHTEVQGEGEGIDAKIAYCSLGDVNIVEWERERYTATSIVVKDVYLEHILIG